MALLINALLEKANAQLPDNFPTFTVTTYDSNAVAPGYIFLAVAVPVTNNGYYAMILKNDGTPFWYKHLDDEAYDFKVLPDGYLHYAEFIHPHSWVGGGDALHEILDSDYNPVETVTAGNGYVAESHEFQLMPNGHALLHAYYQTYMDLSKVIPGGYPNALISGTTIQELDAQRNVVWQWRTWDNFDLTNYQGIPLDDPSLKQAVINAFHVNSESLDSDGNLLVSNYAVDLWKINRQTGKVMWRLGGPANEFSFVGEDPEEAVRHFASHAAYRLANGNILLYCNGDRQGTHSSSVYEYRLDEVHKVATLVWSYTPPTPIYAWHRGNAQRLPNGNTMIGWGGTSTQPPPACTEVTADGRVVFEMKFDDPRLESYRAFRFPYPPASQATVYYQAEITPGNSYDFPTTGVTVDVIDCEGGYNSLDITREPYGPVNPLFTGKAPIVLPVRVSLAEGQIPTLSATIKFDAQSFGFTTPTNLTVYHRPQTGKGLFVPQTTAYNPVTRKLLAAVTLSAQDDSFGEFIFGYPDVAEVPYPPILNAVENYRGIQPYGLIAPLAAQTGVNYKVNQELPISLSWSPNSFARSYHLQIATTPDFANPVVDVPSQTNAFYVWADAAPDTTYYYRVSTANAGGTSEWSSGSFQTTSPMIQVTAPNGGDAWQRGLSYFIQWDDNLAENVAIGLYKAGAFAETISTNCPSTGAYKWEADLNLLPGSDYTIRITSATNSALFGLSDPFSILDAPTLNPGLLTRLADGRLQVVVTAPGMAQATLLGSGNLSTWEEIQTLPLHDDSAIFIDNDATNFSSRFYRLRIP